MDILKKNLFYVILIAAVLVISVPSFILASQRQEKIKKAMSDADNKLDGLRKIVKNLKPVNTKALQEADKFSEQWEAQRARAHELLKQANKHMDDDFLVAPDKPNGTPDPAKYRAAYSAGYDALVKSLGRLMDGKKGKFSTKATFVMLPTPDQIQISQKQFWILKELAATLADPDCALKDVSNVSLDFVPNVEGVANQPDDSGRFWIYPIRIDFRIDFRAFPLFLQKLVDNQNVMFFVDAFTITRSFEESKPVYVPIVAVTLYCQAWDYINVANEFEKNNLNAYKGKSGKGVGKPAGRGGAPAAPAAAPAKTSAPAAPAESAGSDPLEQ